MLGLCTMNKLGALYWNPLYISGGLMQLLRKTFIMYSSKIMNFKEPNINHHWKY